MRFADEAPENQLTQLGVKIRESANQIWLAGLGAFSKAQQEGTKMFETLVEEGENAARLERSYPRGPPPRAARRPR